MHLFLLLTKFYHVHLLTVRVYVGGRHSHRSAAVEVRGKLAGLGLSFHRVDSGTEPGSSGLVVSSFNLWGTSPGQKDFLLFFFFLRQHPTYPRLSLNLLQSSGTTVWNSPVPCGDYRCVPATPRASNWRGGGEGGRALCILGNKVPFLSRILEVHWKNVSLELEMSISCIFYFM